MIDPHVASASMTTADRAAWASAIGSVAAAVVALGIALSSGIAHRIARSRDGRALAAYLAADVHAVDAVLEHAISYIEKFLEGDPNTLMKLELAAFAAQTNAGLAGSVLEAKVDQFGVLPNGIGQKLAGAVGSLSVCRGVVGRFAGEIRMTVPPKWQEFCEPILNQLSKTKSNFRPTRDYCRKVVGNA